MTDETRTQADPLDVDLAAYSGPIDVLLELVAQRRMEITEVSVAQIVDDFLRLIDTIGERELDAASKFLLVAATLIQIKTRRLLPIEGEIEIDEDLLADAERDVLLARLLAARTFADVARVLQDALAEGDQYKPRSVAPEPQMRRVAPDLLRQVGPPDLARIAAQVLAEKDEPHIDVSHIQPIRISVADTIMRLSAELPGAGQISYRKLCAHSTRIEAVVKFLALLELLKAGVISAGQDGLDDDIIIRWIPDSSYEVVPSADWDIDVSEGAIARIEHAGRP